MSERAQNREAKKGAGREIASTPASQERPGLSTKGGDRGGWPGCERGADDDNRGRGDGAMDVEGRAR